MKTECMQKGSRTRCVSVFLLSVFILVFVACDGQVEERLTNQVADYSTKADVRPYDKQTIDLTPDNSIEPELVLLPCPMPHNTIAAGFFHSLVIIDGRLWAWGSNSGGQLGDGTTENRSSPVEISTDTDWISVDVGMNHTVALKANGSLWAWGHNEFGQLGDGTTENRTSPVQIGTDTDWASIVAGDDYTMAIKTDGTLWGWGRNSHGQIGDGIVSESIDGLNVLKPIQISMYEVWVKMTAPSRWGTEFQIKEDGSLWGWGNNDFGQLGDGTTIGRDTPIQIGTDTDWVNIALGDTRVVAVKADGSVWSWGWAGPSGPYQEVCISLGLIGDGTYGEDRHKPVKILEGFSSPQN